MDLEMISIKDFNNYLFVFEENNNVKAGII
jgi:hypothetical protein